MKKIYSLLLLGVLTFLSVDTAWATDYYAKYPWKDGSNWSWQKMTEVSTGTYICYGKYFSGANAFNMDEDGTHNGQYHGGGMYTKEKEYFVVASGVSSGDYCVFTYTTSDYKVRITKYSGTMREVSITANKDANLYVWEESSKLQFNGEWPGLSVTASTATTVYVPDNSNLRIKYSNNGSSESDAIYLGIITANSSYSFTLGDNYQAEGFITGDMLDWQCRYEYRLISNSATINLPIANHEYQIKPVFYGTWFGCYHDNEYALLTPLATTALSDGELYADWGGSPSNPVKIVTTIAGDYTFTWNSSAKQVTVTYPDTYTRPAANGAWGTICLPVAASIPSNATFYKIKGLRSATENASEATSKPYSIIIESVDALSAGEPYIFNMTGSGGLSITLNNNNYSDEAGSANGLHGTYDDTTISANYVLTSAGEIQAAATGCRVSANRAYIILSDILTTYTRSEVVSPAPGRRIIETSMESNTTTSIDNVEANEKAVKFFENGQMYIQRNGVTYDVTGRAVK